MRVASIPEDGAKDILRITKSYLFRLMIKKLLIKYGK